jgi:N-acetylmuramoyl-L-alanine amidase
MDVDTGAWEIPSMGSPACAAAIALLLATPNEVWAASAHRAVHTSTHTVSKAASRTSARSPAKPKRPAASKRNLEQAKAAMTALARDRQRRRFRHNWEKAIGGLLDAAHGTDRAAALSEAARARYALYRWSADEADRAKALQLAEQAAHLGGAEGRSLAAAIRREAGDDRQTPGPRRAEPKAPAAGPAREEDEPEDPALERVVNALAAGDGVAPAPEADGPARVSEVRAWSSPDYTRVAIYLSRWVKWQQLELPAIAGKPRRLVVDLAPAVLEGRTQEQAVGGGRLSRVRSAQYDANTVRVVLDLDGDDRVQVFRLDDPPRLVLDLAAPVSPAAVAIAGPPAARPETAVGAPSPDAAAEVLEPPDAATGQEELDTVVELPPRARAMLEGAQAQAGAPLGGEPAAVAPPPAAAPPASAAEPEGEEADRAIRRIVVDAGHGGHDPGAIGPTRIREKDVTLAIARRLAGKLRAAGFEVVLTRSSDRFLELEERTALANAARGDLFVSIHANAHPRRVRSGIETYFLNVTDDRYARRLAARENGADLSVGGDLARILTDLDAKASADASLRLARLVQRDVCGGVRAHVGEVQDLGVKSALFYVLLGARMPAVLVETGFISHRVEEKRLASSRYQEEVASGIARAVERFAQGEPAVARR